MNAKILSGALAALMITGTAITADAQSSSGRRKVPDQTVTVTGCVQKEADYRKANRFFNPLGVGDEYILTEAAMAPANGAAAATGTSGTADVAYELEGKNEKMAAPFVGKRVEIAGTVKQHEVSADGKPTGGPSAGVTADLKLAELEITSVHETTGTCTPLKN
jgi:hypothetical protein